MSLESFIGLDSGEPMSAASLEKLRERMAAAAAQIKAIKKEEGKQKKKEDELLKILLKFIKSTHKTTLVLLISRVLEQNVPANFVLAMVLLGNPEIQQAVGNFLMLQRPENLQQDQSLIIFGQGDESFPLKLRIEIDQWIKNMLAQAEELPQKIVKTCYLTKLIELERENNWDDPEYRQERVVQPSLVKLAAHILDSYMKQNQHQEDSNKIEQFCEFILQGILTKTEENLQNRALLGE